MEGSLSGPLTVVKSKICLVGDEAVGKTSLIHRFVHGVFDESYIRTMGAVPTKKTIDLKDVGGRPVRLDLTILDIMGKRTFLELFREAYFRGARGILAVADITRRSSLQGLAAWIESVESTSGPLPTIIVVNKTDLVDAAEYGLQEIEDVAKPAGLGYYLTSAMSGANVEEAFQRLGFLVAERLLAAP